MLEQKYIISDNNLKEVEKLLYDFLGVLSTEMLSDMKESKTRVERAINIVQSLDFSE